MSHEPGATPFLTCLGLSITTRCPVACSHCIVEAGPRRRDEMSAGDVAGWLRQAAAYRGGRIRSVVITGGEPFYNLALLTDILQSAVTHGLVPAVVTNAFWATSPAAAVNLLASVPQIRMLTVSADAYHQKAIPFQNVRNAILAARELGIAHNVAGCMLREDDPAWLVVRAQLEQVIEPDLIRVAAVYPAGRALRQFGQADEDWAAAQAPGACCAADYPTIFPDGSLTGCMGLVKELPTDHPLHFGSLRERTLEQILDAAEANVALHMLRLWGPARLLELLASGGYAGLLPQRFWKRGTCDLCYALAENGELRRGLAQVAGDPEVALKTAYGRVYYLQEESMMQHLKQAGVPDRTAAAVPAAAPAGQEAEPLFLANLGFLITYKCQVACPHCVVGAGPHRSEEMNLEECCSWIGQAASYGGGRIKAVCFTGGEPFCDLDRLERMCLEAVASGMVPTAVTNAFWAATPEDAAATLRSLPALRVISVSTDSHHLKQIPFERVRHALEAGEQLGLHCSVSVCTEDLNSPRHAELVERLAQIIAKDKISTVVTFPVGRGAGLLQIGKFQMTDERPAGACSGAHTPVVFPDGRVVACIGPVIDLRGAHPLLLGNLREQPLEEILSAAEINVVLHVIRVWGPGRLCQILEERGFGDKLPRCYVRDSICSLCHAVMANPDLREALAGLAQDLSLLRKTAYARQFYFGETAMVEALASKGLLDDAA